MLPFVSRLAYQQVCEERDRLRTEIEQERQRHAEVLAHVVTRSDNRLGEALDLLRESRQAPEFPAPPQSPLAALGPRTTAALADMAQGMPPANRRAMEVKALSLWAEYGKRDDGDAIVSDMVRRGEPVGR